MQLKETFMFRILSLSLKIPTSLRAKNNRPLLLQLLGEGGAHMQLFTFSSHFDTDNTLLSLFKVFYDDMSCGESSLSNVPISPQKGGKRSLEL